MSPTRQKPPEPVTRSRYVRALRVLKLLFTVILLALAIWQAVSGGGPIPLP